MQLLSENAIVHISAGFQGPFILQAFGIRRDLYRRGAYNFCVTDGSVYIGARFECAQDIELDNYNFVQITAKFEDRTHLIIVKTLEVVSTAGRKIVGQPPCTLQDYFNRETRQNGYENLPSKRIKLNEESIMLPRYKAHDITALLSDDTPKHQSEQKEATKLQSFKRKKTGAIGQAEKRELRFADEESQEDRKSALEVVQDSKSVSKNSPVVQVAKGRDIEKNCDLSDLYERSTGWVILCRVNYMSIVECQNGIFAVNFIISDEAGSEMKCVYFVGDLETARETLSTGGYYLFAGGEVKMAQKEKELQITFDRNSDIIPQKQVSFPTLPGRFKLIEKILDEEHGSTLNVLGVVRKIKTREQFKSKIKYTATLCDPIRHLQVDFMLFLTNGEREISVGMVIVLHNFQVFKQQNIFRLNSTYRSYYFEDRGKSSPGDLLYKMHQLINLTDWQTEAYRNISMFAFTHRTIHDLREITRRTDDERLYSALDVWTLDLSRKKSYQACKSCKRPTEKKEMGLFECMHCKKIVETLITHALSVNFGDFTGSVNIDVIGEHAETLLRMSAGDFNDLNSEEQTSHLESLRYRNVMLRLKSEKKGEKKETHSVWGIDRPSPQTTIKEIRKRMQINRLKEEEEW